MLSCTVPLSWHASLTEWVAVDKAKNGQVEGLSQPVNAGAYGQRRKTLAGHEN